MDQNALTLAAPIKPDQLPSLDALLKEIGNSLQDNSYLDITRLTSTHFLRWVILPASGDTPPRLLFESNHDGDTETYLRDFVSQAGIAIDAIYGKCVGYPAAGLADRDAVVGYLRKHAVPYAAFYIGYRGRSVPTVKAALAAREQLARFLDAAGASHAFQGFSQEQVWEAVKAEAVRLGISPIAPQRTVPTSAVVLAAGGAVLGLVALLTKTRAWLPFLGLLGGLTAFLRWRETQDAKKWTQSEKACYLPSATDNEKIRLLAVREDILTQNQLTHVVPIRPGVFRRFTVKFVLAAINLLAKVIFNKGSLGGIPTIHFARWVILDDGSLLFFSNYDGSWDNYLGDFVDRAAVGLTGVWSNTEEFPPTRFLLGDGARAIEFFKAWTRAHQVPTQVWYSAYPNNTVVNIRDAAQMLENLGQPAAPGTLASWLRRI